VAAAARLVALATAAFAEALPVLALAQGAGDPTPRAGRTYGWLWMLAAVIVVFALFRMFFSRSRRIPPPRP
jgi:hypothetical protein